ncbi:MAG: hypothetical protein FH758_10945 [Firmicutes bacterium]|nr:hypothetical protein [Bacillota bacterium]
MDFKKKIIPITMTLLLGIGTLSIANAAAPVDYQQQMANWIENDPNPMSMNMSMNSLGNNVDTSLNNTTNSADPLTATAPVEITPDLINQMIQNCWQANQTMIDQWLNATDLTRDDLLEMERSWMEGVMQQNPNLTEQQAIQMNQTWLKNKLDNYKPVNDKTKPQAKKPNVHQPNWNQQTHPPGAYHGWNNRFCW